MNLILGNLAAAANLTSAQKSSLTFENVTDIIMIIVVVIAFVIDFRKPKFLETTHPKTLEEFGARENSSISGEAKTSVIFFRKIITWKYLYTVFIGYAVLMCIAVSTKYNLRETVPTGDKLEDIRAAIREEVRRLCSYDMGAMRELFILIALTAVLMYMMLKYGLDNKKYMDTVEVNPPAGIDPAIAGLIYNSEIKAQTPITIFMRLESKGYISLKPILTKGEKSSVSNFFAKKLYVEPQKPPTLDELVAKRQIRIELIRPLNEKLSLDAKVFLSTVFSNGVGPKNKRGAVVGSQVQISGVWTDTFNKLYYEIVEEGYVRVIEDSLEERQRQLDMLAIEHKRLCDTYEVEMRAHEARMMQLPQLTRIEQIMYKYMFLESNEISILKNRCVNAGLRSVYKILNIEIRNKVFDAKATAAKGIACILGLISLITATVGIVVRAPLPYEYRGAYYLMLLLLVLIGFACTFMDRRTVFGEELVARIRGFRRFIKEVEADRLMVLVDENPNYFFDILPYAYILGVSNVWIKKANMVGLRLYGEFFDNDSFNDLLQMFDSKMDHVAKNVNDPNAYKVDEFFDKEFYKH